MKKLACGLLLSSLVIGGCKKSAIRTAPVVTPPVTATGSSGLKSYYVSDGSGSDANNGLATSTAMKTIAAAFNAASPGDTVFVMTGTYAAVGNTLLNITKSGTADKYITIKAYAGQSPKITAVGAVWNTISINGSYIVIEGLEMQGNNAAINYADALAAYNSAAAGATVDNSFAQYNTNAISIGGPRTESKFPHHVIIRNCKVHDFPGGALNSIQADYTTFENNTVYNNAWYMMYAGSGISILNPYNTDATGDNTKYRNYIRNNIVYNNKCLIPWISTKAFSDGNGIIIDVNQYGYGLSGTNGAFVGRTLVENNVSYNNGGSGIHSYRGDHTDIINNTVYGNGYTIGYADLFAGSANDVKILNNIAYARTGGKCNTNSGNTNVAYNYNIWYNGTTAVLGANDKVANPLFVAVALDGTANFSLSPGSPAIDWGTNTLFSAKDIKGIARPQGSGIDCGAYEYK